MGPRLTGKMETFGFSTERSANDFLKVPEYLHHEVRVKRGEKFGNQIQSPDREGGVSRFNAPHPPAATLPLLVAACPR